MQLFTTEQTESWQFQMLDMAGKANGLDTLCWFIQMILPPPPKPLARTMTQQERQSYRYRTACAPSDWVPIVRIGSDPKRSRIDAELLAGLFAAHNRDGVKFAPALALTADLQQVKHYEFGDPWDCVCSLCGSVFPGTVPDVDICEMCERRSETA